SRLGALFDDMPRGIEKTAAKQRQRGERGVSGPDLHMGFGTNGPDGHALSQLWCDAPAVYESWTQALEDESTGCDWRVDFDRGRTGLRVAKERGERVIERCPDGISDPLRRTEIMRVHAVVACQGVIRRRDTDNGYGSE